MITRKPGMTPGFFVVALIISGNENVTIQRNLKQHLGKNLDEKSKAIEF